jgi:hypothetical protein
MEPFFIDLFTNSEAARRLGETARWGFADLTFLGAKPLRRQWQKQLMRVLKTRALTQMLANWSNIADVG